MVDRRQFIGMSAALLGMRAHAAPGLRPRAGEPEVRGLLDEIAEGVLAAYPESATSLGLDRERRAALKGRLSDRSPAGIATIAASARSNLARLQSIDARGLSPAVRLNLGVARTAHELAVEGFAFGFGDAALLNLDLAYRNSPYVVAQNTGAFVETPDFLGDKHSIAGAADAHAYLERMKAYARNLDGETARLAHDRAAGIVAPAFLLDTTLKQLRNARALRVEDWGLVKAVARRTAGMPGNFAKSAARLAAQVVAPALGRQIEELARHRAAAGDDAGVWKLAQGDVYYRWALRAATTTNLTPDEVHELGRAELAALEARMEPILRGMGLTQGTVGERMTALGRDPRYAFPDTDAGRIQILDYINGRIADIRARMPRAFATLVPGRLIVKRVPPAIEAGAPEGYATAGSMDGSVPGVYHINLMHTSIWPRFSLPTLSYHEGIPGHVWQGEYSYQLPLIRSLLAFNAYSEGWALYAEQLADELGVYEGDPVGQLGYLQSLSFRACRLVVDTGLHAKRWTRAQAIDWFTRTNGSPVDQVSSEVDRYCAWPGQACGYKVGHSHINRLRDHARAALGPGFDLRRFNDAIVLAGNVPLTLLDAVVEEHIAGSVPGRLKSTP